MGAIAWGPYPSLEALAWSPWPGVPGLRARGGTDRQNIPCILQDIVPLGPLPKKGGKKWERWIVKKKEGKREENKRRKREKGGKERKARGKRERERKE